MARLKLLPSVLSYSQYSADNGHVSMALGKEDVVGESMSGRLLNPDSRKIRVGREEGTAAALRSMGATLSGAGSVSSVCPRGKLCCAVRGMAPV